MCGQNPHFSEGRRRKLYVNYFTDIHRIRFMYNVVDLCRKDKFVSDVLCIYHSCTVFINAVNSVLGLHATPLKWQIFLLEQRKFKNYKSSL